MWPVPISLTCSVSPIQSSKVPRSDKSRAYKGDGRRPRGAVSGRAADQSSANSSRNIEQVLPGSAGALDVVHKRASSRPPFCCGETER